MMPLMCLQPAVYAFIEKKNSKKKPIHLLVLRLLNTVYRQSLGTKRSMILQQELGRLTKPSADLGR